MKAVVVRNSNWHTDKTLMIDFGGQRFALLEVEVIDATR
jgi:hypothetical protein